MLELLRRRKLIQRRCLVHVPAVHSQAARQIRPGKSARVAIFVETARVDEVRVLARDIRLAAAFAKVA